MEDIIQWNCIFYGDGTYAYIGGAEATGRTFSGTWYNTWQDFRDRINGQPFICVVSKVIA